MIGHEDWIRDLDICLIKDRQLLIASSSQDNYIRLWKLNTNQISLDEEIATKLVIDEDNPIDDLQKTHPSNQNEATGYYNEDESEEISTKTEILDEELKLKSSLFTIHLKNSNKYIEYSINLESVLYGHEDWIYTVKFHPRLENKKQPLILISASMDKTLVVWSYDEKNSVWIDVVRSSILYNFNFKIILRNSILILTESSWPNQNNLFLEIMNQIIRILKNRDYLFRFKNSI